MSHYLTHRGLSLKCKGLVFFQHSPNYAEQQLALAHREKPPRTLFVFYGRRLLTEPQIKEHVEIMIERNEYIAQSVRFL